MTFRHGVYVSQIPTRIVPALSVDSAIPLVVGTAPVHMVTEGETGPVNKVNLFYSYADAVATLGYSEDWAKYTLSEFIYSQFVLFNVAPVVLINVFDPTVHKTSVAAEELTFADGKVTVAKPGLVGDPVVKSSDEVTTYTKGDDYKVSRITGVITRVAAGAIGATDTVKVSYDYGDPTQVGRDHIIGGVDAQTGVKSGLELIDQVFPETLKISCNCVCPKWSSDPLVAAVMTSKMDNINGGIFKGYALTDIPSGGTGCTKYQDVPAWKSTNNYTNVNQINCWPMVSLEGKVFHMSTQLAGLMGRVDAYNRGIPYESPSNKNLEMNALVLADGTEVNLGHQEANYLNQNGVVTALNWAGRGWVSWGNRTGAYPGNTDASDSLIPIQRMFQWTGNTFVLTFWAKLDKPINRRLIETIVDSHNIWLNGLAAIEAILGGRLEFLPDENPATSLMDGTITFHQYLTPPSPAEEIHMLQEYDVGYLSTLFGS